MRMRQPPHFTNEAASRFVTRLIQDRKVEPSTDPVTHPDRPTDKEAPFFEKLSNEERIIGSIHEPYSG